VALTATQVRDMHLPPLMTAKRKSSRYSDFVAQHGDNVFELEAVAPEQLQAILRDAIDSVLDVAAYNAEVDAERNDAVQLATIRRRIRENVGAVLPDNEGEDR
jgi:hypothetical protein